MNSCASFGYILLNHLANVCWSLGIDQNAIDRLGGKPAELVFVLGYGPGSGSTYAECFRLLVQ